jgi:SAM-dependent methyltransferase
VTSALRRRFPEVAAGGFSRVDGTVAFYQRVNALVGADSTVLDFGAGRGAFLDDAVAYRRGLRLLRGRVREVIGADVDPAVRTNPALDRAVVLAPGGPLPLPDGGVDLVVSDFTFEHVTDPARVAAELTRVLRPGGWVCARTPAKWGVVGLGARAVPNRWHVPLLRTLQPGKPACDTFPTAYRLNTAAALRRHFPPALFEDLSYRVDSEPAYAAGSRLAWWAFGLLGALTPERGRSTFCIFLRKRSAAGGGAA